MHGDPKVASRPFASSSSHGSDGQSPH
jgi:hypothetical protein